MSGARAQLHLAQEIVVNRNVQVVLVFPFESFDTIVQLPSKEGDIVEKPKPPTDVVFTTLAFPMSMPAPGVVVGPAVRLSPLLPMMSCGARGGGEKSKV